MPKAVAAHGIELKQQMQQSQQLAEAYARDNIGYKLISRNCVSELFDTIDIALVDGLSQRGEAFSEQSLEQETRLRLGDGFDPVLSPLCPPDKCVNTGAAAMSKSCYRCVACIQNPRPRAVRR